MGNRFEKDRLPNPRFPSLRSNEASVTFADEGHPMGSNKVQEAKPLGLMGSDLIRGSHNQLKETTIKLVIKVNTGK